MRKELFHDNQWYKNDADCKNDTNLENTPL
jgi:hypothetical protein